jgi:hypothetical protein
MLRLFEAVFRTKCASCSQARRCVETLPPHVCAVKIRFRGMTTAGGAHTFGVVRGREPAGQ